MFAAALLPLVVPALVAQFDMTVTIDTDNWPANPIRDVALTIRLYTDRENFKGGPLTITKNANGTNARNAIFHVLSDSTWTVTRVAETRVILTPPPNARFRGFACERADWAPLIRLELKAKAKAK